MFSWLATTFSSADTIPDTSWMWVRVVAFLVCLLPAPTFITQYNRKKQFRSFSQTKGKILIADTCPLGNRQYLVVAQYGSEKHLLGINPNAISHLSKIEETDSITDFQSSNKDESLS